MKFLKSFKIRKKWYSGIVVIYFFLYTEDKTFFVEKY